MLMITYVPKIFPNNRSVREISLVPYSMILKGSIIGVGCKKLPNHPLTPRDARPQIITSIIEIEASDAVTLMSLVGGRMISGGSNSCPNIFNSSGDNTEIIFESSKNRKSDPI